MEKELIDKDGRKYKLSGYHCDNCKSELAITPYGVMYCLSSSCNNEEVAHIKFWNITSEQYKSL